MEEFCKRLCIEDSSSDCYILTASKVSLLLFVCKEEVIDLLMQEILYFLDQLLYEFSQVGLSNVNFGVGLPVASITDINDSYQASLCCAELFFSHAEENRILYANVAQVINQYTITDTSHKILSALEAKNYVLVKEQLTAMKEYFKSVWVTAQKIKLSMVNLCFLAFSLAAQKRNETFNGLTAEQLILITQAKSIEDLWQQIEIFLTQCIDLLNVSSEPAYRHIVHECLIFIESHYTEEINIIKAAKEIHMNADYLSRILKKECGCPFSQLLTKYRLEKACSLLSNINLSISEVSSMTGFKDFRYFGQVFKNEYKMTPTEYRKTVYKTKR